MTTRAIAVPGTSSVRRGAAIAAALLGGLLFSQRVTSSDARVPVTIGPSLLPRELASRAALTETERRALDAAVYERRVREDSLSAADWSMLAAIRLQQARDAGDPARFRSAEAAARRSLTLRQARNAKTLLLLSSALLAQHRFPEALAVADTMVALEPNIPSFRALQFELQVEMGQYDAATANARLLARDRHHPAVAPRLARWYEIRGAPDSAFRLLRDARAAADTVRTLPAEQRAWFDLRVVDFALRNGQLALADTALRTSRARSPQDGRLAQASARLAALRGEWPRARQLLDSIGDATDLATSALAVDVMLAQRDSVAAQRWLARVEQLNRDAPEPFARGWTQARLTHGVRLAETRALLEREIGIRQDIYGWDQLAVARLKTGDIAGAQHASDRARALGTRDANLVWHAALIADAAGDRRRASALAGEALAINPHFHPRDAGSAAALAHAR